MITKSPRSSIRLACWLLLAPLLLTGGCAGLYFREVNAPPQPPPRHTLQAWPSREYWTGIIFNGEKIGLTRLALLQAGDLGGPYELRSEALLAFHFLGFNKRVTLKAQDWVTDDLRLERFAHEYDLDGQKLKLSGKVERGQLLVERETAGRTSHETIPLAEVLYPTSAIALYPTLHGLEIGKEYSYLVYDGQSQQVSRVSQTIDAYQESDLYVGRAFQVVTKMGGQNSTLWLNDRGEPVLEIAGHGLLISTLETEKQAKSYLARASVNKRDVLVEYSRVRVNMSLPHPRTVTTIQVAIQGLPDTFTMPSDQLQQCERRDGPISGQRGGQTQCLIHALNPSGMNQRTGLEAADLSPYLKPTSAIESQDPKIQKTAKDIVGTSTDPIPQIQQLVAWIQEHVEQVPVDVFSSLQVLEGRKAECQGLTWLYTALARSLGIPTRVTNGLVYSQELEGFLYHTWAESYVGSGWLPVDPTFGQIGVDATHIKLLDGDRLADLLPLVDIVGKIRLEILSYRSS